MDRLGAVRRAAAHFRSAGAHHRHREPPASSPVLSAQPRARMDGAVPRAADHGHHRYVRIAPLQWRWSTARPSEARRAKAAQPDDFARIQGDTLSLHAKTLLPLLLAHSASVDPRDRPALDRLRQWNFDATADSAATAIFQAWFLHLTPALVADELGPGPTELYRAKFSFVSRFLGANAARRTTRRGATM